MVNIFLKISKRSVIILFFLIIIIFNYQINYIQAVSTVKDLPTLLCNTTHNLSEGMNNPDVKNLQKYLNTNGFPLAPNGVGSLGKETTYFGPLTKNSLIKFQKDNKIIANIGIFDSNTKDFMGCKTKKDQGENLLCSINRDLNMGMKGDDVKNLQKYLNTNGFPLAPNGVGSLGKETTYFGSLTKQALNNFQLKNNLDKTGIFDSIVKDFLNCVDKTTNIDKDTEEIIPNLYYTISYTASTGGVINGNTNQKIKSGEDGTPVTATPNSGYYFTNWSDGLTTNPRIDTIVTINKYINANFARRHSSNHGNSPSLTNYIISYNDNESTNGTKPNDQIKSHDVDIILASNTGSLTRDGYHFVGWNTSSDGTGIDYTEGSNYTTNISITLYAKWIQNETNNFTLTYIAGSGGSITGVSTQTVNAGENGLEIIATPDTGRHFVKWSDDVMTNNRTDLNVMNDISVTAEFAINTYTLNYTAGTGGVINGSSTQVINFGANSSTVTAVSDPGYHFVEWSDHITNAEREELNVSADLSFSAVFEVNSIVTVTNINPTSGYNTDSVNLTSITGTGFATGATVKLTKSGQPDVPCTGFTIASPNSITGGLCHITSATAGDWNIVVTNLDTGSGNLVDGFTVQEYSIGSTGPAGGLIFYINPNYEEDGWKYLEAAPSDQHDNIDWWDDYSNPTGATNTSIGAGLSNTNTIIGESNPGNTSAVGIAYNYSLNGYSDWFLPSIEELNLMRDNLYSHTPDSLGNFEPTGYWSSSEVSGTNAYRRSFTVGVEESKSKSTFYNIRVARRFSTTTTYSITYSGNGNTSGSEPTDVNHYPSDSLVTTLPKGTLLKDGHKFIGWNTLSDGSGTHYNEGDEITISSSDVILYAEWEVDFYITIFPDTQSSVNWKRSVVTNQIDWIINNKDILDIRFVGHVGDLVAEWDQDLTEWDFIQDEMGQLGTAGIPYSILPGNHDYAQMTRNNTMLNSYFPLSTFSSMPTYEGSYNNDSDNTYHILNVGGKELLIISLEFGPRDAVVNWANGILQANPNKKAIIITHAYINTDGELLSSGMDHAASNGYNLGVDVNDGDELWNNLIYPNNNVAFVICGHDGTPTDGSGRRESTHENEAPVHQFLTNYQYYSPIANGSYFFLLHFTEDSVEVRTYSSYLNQYKTDSESQADYSWSF